MKLWKIFPLRSSIRFLGRWSSMLTFLLSFSVRADPAHLISERDNQAAISAGGNGDSVAPQITPDGRFVLFTSSASDLVTNRNGLFVLNLFLRDRMSNTTEMVSVNLDGNRGGNGNSMYGMVSANGRYVVFQSDASDLGSNDTNGMADIFRRDMIAGTTTTLVSIAANVVDPVMTPDGRFIVFASSSTNLVANDTNGIPDIFVLDTLSNLTTQVSVGAFGSNAFMESSVITPDGRYVAFASNASGLAAGVSPTMRSEIYLRDLMANTTKWVSSNASIVVSNFFHYAADRSPPSYHPILSDDGKFVAFDTDVTNIFSSGFERSVVWVFRYDSVTDSTTIVGTNGFPRWHVSGDNLYGPEMSPDGRFITYVATNGPQKTWSVNLWDAQTGTNMLISASLNGSYPTNSISYAPAVSADGRFVSFLSTATNLVTNNLVMDFSPYGVLLNKAHIYLRDVQASTTQLLDVDTNNAGVTDQTGTVPSMTPDGRLVVFDGSDGGLVPDDNNKGLDVFMRDAVGGTTELISQRAVTPQTGNRLSRMGPFALSADGRWLAFTSDASDLVTNDFNNRGDVFVKDLLTGSNLLVSVGTNGSAALGGTSFSPRISANGRYVVFVSKATDLVVGDNNAAADIFLRDLQTGTTVRVNTNGFTSTPGDCSSPVISDDGRYVAFLGVTNRAAFAVYPISTFWCDVAAGTNVKLAAASANSPAMSANGQRVAYFDSASRLYVWDAQLAANIYTNPASITFASLAPGGDRLLCQEQAAKRLSILDLSSTSVPFSFTNDTSARNSSAWSSDGRFVAFVTGAAIVSGDANGTSDVFLYDLQTGTLTLISVNSDATASANAASDHPAISGDGRFVTYRSFATNILQGVAILPSLYVFDRAFGTNRLLATGSDGNWSSLVSHPIVNSDGSVIAFLGLDSGIVSGDLNRAPDVFAQSQNVLIADTDVDGIPDWWTQLYFVHPTGQAGDQSLAGDDPDGDGMSNLQEYLTGTVPTDSNSAFRVTISTASASGGNVWLIWPAVPGKNYQVQYTEDLANPLWLEVSSGVTVLGSQGRYPASALSSGRYYRVVMAN
jgi:Tol biopolymer transport system component